MGVHDAAVECCAVVCGVGEEVSESVQAGRQGKRCGDARTLPRKPLADRHGAAGCCAVVCGVGEDDNIIAEVNGAAGSCAVVCGVGKNDTHIAEVHDAAVECCAVVCGV